MSKSTIKKLLQSMTKEDIIEMVLDMYSARKEAKEYLEFYAEPDEKGKLEEYKAHNTGRILSQEKKRTTDSILCM